MWTIIITSTTFPRLPREEDSFSTKEWMVDIILFVTCCSAFCIFRMLIDYRFLYYFLKGDVASSKLKLICTLSVFSGLYSSSLFLLLQELLQELFSIWRNSPVRMIEIQGSPSSYLKCKPVISWMTMMKNPLFLMLPILIMMLIAGYRWGRNVCQHN